MKWRRKRGDLEGDDLSPLSHHQGRAKAPTGQRTPKLMLVELYFDKGGALLKNTRRYLDLKTKKAKKPGEFFDHSIPMYRHVRALPFHKLL